MTLVFLSIRISTSPHDRVISRGVSPSALFTLPLRFFLANTTLLNTRAKARVLSPRGETLSPESPDPPIHHKHVSVDRGRIFSNSVRTLYGIRNMCGGYSTISVFSLIDSTRLGRFKPSLFFRQPSRVSFLVFVNITIPLAYLSRGFIHVIPAKTMKSKEGRPIGIWPPPLRNRSPRFAPPRSRTRRNNRLNGSPFPPLHA